MSGIVLDASVIVARLLREIDGQEQVEHAMDIALAEGVWAPALWLYETGNSLLFAERRGRVSHVDVAKAMDSLMELPVQLDGIGDTSVVMALARQHGLSFYDAAYLEVAIRRDAQLATFDRAMARAAAAAGITLI